MTSAIVGALACQRNSFLKTLNTRVVSSFEYVPPATSRDKQNKNKKTKETKEPKEVAPVTYAVELEDTILFPEGGGQPFDQGSLVLLGDKKVQVKTVLRDKLRALHITEEPVDSGTEVTLELDWNRRIDLMQQHTGQHLLSAILDTYNLETLSWSMGETINYIELPTKVSDEIIDEVQDKINKHILDDEKISVVTPDEHGGELDVSNIPDDYDKSQGIIRVVKIGELDANPCCGTHLQSTVQIQSIALLHQTAIRGGHSRLHFLCGNRVNKYLRKSHGILKDVSGNQLSCQIEEVVDKVSALNASYRKALSRESSLLRELGALEASKIFNVFNNTDRLVDYVYRADNGPEYLQLFQKELATLINSTKSNVNTTDKQTVVLVNGDYPSGTGGMVKVLGPQAETIQAELKQRITNLKGGGKGNSFQGKVTKYEKGEIESVLNYLETFRE